MKDHRHKDYRTAVCNDYDIINHTSGNRDSFCGSVVQKNGKYGLIHLDGRETIPCKHDFISYVREGRVVIGDCKRKKFWLADCWGHQKGAKYDKMGLLFVNGRVNVALKGKCGHIDLEGNVTTDLVWDSSGSFEDYHYACVSRNGKQGLVNRQGRVVISPIHDYILAKDRSCSSSVQRDPNPHIYYATWKDVTVEYDLENMTYSFIKGESLVKRVAKTIEKSFKRKSN